MNKDDLKKIAYPRQVVLVTSFETVEIMGKEIEKESILATSWHTPLSFNPGMYGVSLGKDSFTLDLIRKSKCFAVNFMSYSMIDEVKFCESNSGKHMDKFIQSGLTKLECESIEAPRIKEALAHIECELVEEVEVGDHIFVVGRIVNLNMHNNGDRIYQASSGFTTTR